MTKSRRAARQASSKARCTFRCLAASAEHAAQRQCQPLGRYASGRHSGSEPIHCCGCRQPMNLPKPERSRTISRSQGSQTQLDIRCFRSAHAEGKVIDLEVRTNTCRCREMVNDRNRLLADLPWNLTHNNDQRTGPYVGWYPLQPNGLNPAITLISAPMCWSTRFAFISTRRSMEGFAPLP
jgi:hypothetical protein